MTPCWEWVGAVNSAGYGQVDVGRRSKTLVHRAAYEAWWGPIPAGKQIDHRCGVRRCMNPLHLEAVTCREHLLRSPRTWARRNAEKTTCPQGHAYAETRDADGWRWCRECHNAKNRRWWRKHRGQGLYERG